MPMMLKMSKKTIFIVTFIALNGVSFLGIAINWGKIGDAFKSAGNAIKDTATTAGNEINQHVIQPIAEGWEKKREIGRKLDEGADKLEATPDVLEKDAVAGLKTGLIDGINKNL